MSFEDWDDMTQQRTDFLLTLIFYIQLVKVSFSHTTADCFFIIP
uniref:Uncharacterized protein n=1 Tax=Anguilla anguilla TaxID=7936 RepID=A0A0E9R419_ANGAN